MKYFRLALLGVIAFLLSACASQDIPDPDPTTDRSMASSGSDTDGFNDSGMGDGEFFDDAMPNDELGMIIYFDFDQSELRPEYADLLAKHANQLANNARVRVRLEGHADERGSREYNIGLGERRSQSVRRMLLIQGASANQISTVSFGEERPVAFGSDEDSWAQNRRVEIQYTN